MCSSPPLDPEARRDQYPGGIEEYASPYTQASRMHCGRGVGQDSFPSSCSSLEICREREIYEKIRIFQDRVFTKHLFYGVERDLVNICPIKKGFGFY